jgi:holo-[acyl-carrier protein] synthase
VIYGVGTDIVCVARMQSDVERYGDRFARRILTEQEYDDYRSVVYPGRFLAKRFAAKEAAAKALGTGFSAQVGWRDIGVGHEPDGRPVLHYSERVRNLCASAGIARSHLSISDERDYAVAFVVLES